jgi:phosphatidylglycerophosphate synthase
MNRTDAGDATAVPYRYRCTDHSRLAGWISRSVAPAVERWFFPSWSANAVTLAGTLCMAAWVAAVALVPAGMRGGLGSWAALGVAAYVVLDHVDGCRARRRGTSGPWGEFLDHALDAANAMALVWGAGLVAGDAVRPAAVAMAMAATGLATLATWAEQRVTGEAVLGSVGPVEAAAFAAGFMVWCGVPGGGAAEAAVAGFTWAEVGFAVGALGSLATAWAAQRRAREIGGEMAGAMAAMAAMWVAGGLGLPWEFVAVGLAGLTADGAARAIARHLGVVVSVRGDPWASVGLLVAAPFPLAHDVAGCLVAAWLGVRVGFVWRAAAELRPGAQRTRVDPV